MNPFIWTPHTILIILFHPIKECYVYLLKYFVVILGINPCFFSKSALF